MQYTITLTQQELSLIAQALGELPLKFTMDVFLKIQREISEQDAKAAQVDQQ